MAMAEWSPKSPNFGRI